uniref:Putative secreted protein n=1 Tax=Rhipicephalus microplus TaxID=6941 RepID=A0A6G5A2V7_RHIMP
MFNHTFLRNVLFCLFLFPHQVRDASIVIRAFRFWRTCVFFFLWCRPKEHASDVAVQYKVVCVNILFVFVEHGLFIFRSLPRSFLPIFLSI